MLRSVLRINIKGNGRFNRNISNSILLPSVIIKTNQFSTLKKHTTIVGLAVDPNAREKLIALYQDTLEELVCLCLFLLTLFLTFNFFFFFFKPSLSGQLKENVEQLTKFRLRTLFFFLFCFTETNFFFFLV